MIRITQLTKLALITMFMPFAAQAQPELVMETGDGLPLRVDKAFNELIETGFVGFVGVSVDGKIRYARGQASDSLQFQLDSAIDVLSIIKSFTGAAVAILISDGRLTATTTLGEIWDNVPEDKSQLTVHQLLTHTAGLPNLLGRDHEYIGKQALLDLTWATPLRSQPGETYYYSNLGYSILAAVIEAVTDQSFEDYLSEAIFEPLHMTSTGYLEASCCHADAEYVAKTSWGQLEKVSWHLMGNGGMLSTPRDMLKWIEGYEFEKLGGGKVKNLTHQPYIREGETASSYYGYGLVVDATPDFGTAYWHNGGSTEFNSHWRYYPDYRVAIFVASDQWDINSDFVEHAIAKAILADRVKP
ncbi:MAG: serine hydrolase domain-containing protein [Pseudomonadota bacterium]